MTADVFALFSASIFLIAKYYITQRMLFFRKVFLNTVRWINDGEENI